MRLIAETNTDSFRVRIIKPSTSKRTAMEMGAAMTEFSAEPTRAKGSFLDQDSVERQLNQAVLDAIEIGHQR